MLKIAQSHIHHEGKSYGLTVTGMDDNLPQLEFESLVVFFV